LEGVVEGSMAFTGERFYNRGLRRTRVGKTGGREGVCMG